MVPVFFRDRIHVVKFLSAGIFAVLALAVSFAATIWVKWSLILLAVSAPLWILFIIFLVRAAKPD